MSVAKTDENERMIFLWVFYMQTFSLFFGVKEKTGEQDHHQ